MSEYGHGETYRIALANVSDWRRALIDFRHAHPNIKVRTSLDNGRVPMLLRATGRARIEAVERRGGQEVPVEVMLQMRHWSEGGRNALDG